MEQFSGCVLLLVATTFGLPRIMIWTAARWERRRGRPRHAALLAAPVPDGVHDASCRRPGCTYADPRVTVVPSATSAHPR